MIRPVQPNDTAPLVMLAEQSGLFPPDQVAQLEAMLADKIVYSKSLA